MKMPIRELVAGFLGESKRLGNRDWWCCPFHEENTPSFTLVPDGTSFHCFGCGQHGDAIDFLRGMEPALSFRECVDRLNAGDLVNAPRGRSRAKPAPPPPRRGEFWVEHLATLVAASAARLRSRDGAKARAWLHGRGLTLDAIVNAELGLVDADVRLAVGLEPETGEEQEVWVPRGIVIPWRDSAGRIELVNVRRSTGQPKYIAVTGSRRGGLFPALGVVRPGRPVIVCEGEFDCLLLNVTLAGRVPVVTLGAASSDPVGVTLATLSAASRIFLAVDADEAGERLVDRWTKRWASRIERVVPPGECKDWTDAWCAGHDLDEFWATAIPPATAPTPSPPDSLTVERILALLRVGADPLRAIENTDPEDLPPPDVLQASLESARDLFRLERERKE